MIDITQAIYKLYPNVVRTVGDEAFDAEGNQVQYDLAAVTTQAQKDACKAQAKALLSASDWASLSDVDLTNKADFITYRAALRSLALNPVENPTFPTEPTPIWE
jgi:phage I-like protein